MQDEMRLKWEQKWTETEQAQQGEKAQTQKATEKAVDEQTVKAETEPQAEALKVREQQKLVQKQLKEER